MSSAFGRELLELGEPAGEHGPHRLGLRREAEEAVSFSELEVLVAAADDPRRLEAELGNAERQRPERVISIDEELRARTRARTRETVEVGNDAGSLEQHRGDEDRGRALVELGCHPLGQRLRRLGRESHDLEPRLRQPGELPTQRVELAVGRDQPGTRAGDRARRGSASPARACSPRARSRRLDRRAAA